MRLGLTHRACGLLVGLAVAASFVTLPADSATLRSASAQPCTASGVCPTAGHRPDVKFDPYEAPVGASSATTTRNVGEDTSLTNNSGNKLSQVTFVQAIPAGFTFVQDTLGACTATPPTVTCLHGLLPNGQTVSNTLVYKTPVLAEGAQQKSTFAGTWCWAGCDSHNPGANRVDSIPVSDAITVVAAKDFDATYLLAGTEANLATGTAVSAGDPIAGTWTIPGQASDLAAATKKTPNPPGFPACPSGVACRSGDWFGALSPGTASFSPYSTVVYTQDKSLIPSGTTAKNYVVVYTPCITGDGTTPPPEGCNAKPLDRCASPNDVRCTEFVTKLPGGNYRVGVRIGSHNGYMH